MQEAAGGVLLVGCGKMGGALLQGWMRSGRAAASIRVVEPDRQSWERARAALPPAVQHCASVEELGAEFRPAAVVLAVKPQSLDTVLPGYRRFQEAVFLSIAAGKTIAYFARVLGPTAAIVRAMPNTPASIGKGISALVANPLTDARQRELCHALLEAVGAVVWLDEERHMDAVTAVAGSGPAYVFLLAECLAGAGMEAGLAPALAAQLASATVAGAGAMLEQSGHEPSRLRSDVTSPAGTTEAALAVLMGTGGLQPLLTRAVAAAAARSRELAR
jgi:pyrroline-5-carboxylate reductase